jgi:hypothetical protein
MKKEKSHLIGNRLYCSNRCKHVVVGAGDVAWGSCRRGGRKRGRARRCHLRAGLDGRLTVRLMRGVEMATLGS